MTRRGFLWAVLAFLAGLVASPLLRRQWSMESLVMEHTSFLRLAPGTARAFAKDLEADMVSAEGRAAWRQWVRHLKRGEVAFPLAQFLLSTDYFINGADESRVVHYVMFFDKTRPCSNPFAILD